MHGAGNASETARTRFPPALVMASRGSMPAAYARTRARECALSSLSSGSVCKVSLHCRLLSYLPASNGKGLAGHFT